jgi:hypothetical protein
MPVVVTIVWPGVTPSQYEDLRRATDWERPPPGLTFHSAAFDDHALRIGELWQDDAAFRVFWKQHVVPDARAVGLEADAEVTVLAAHDSIVTATTRREDPPARLLVVANQTLGTRQLDDAIAARLGGRRGQVHLVVPATPSRSPRMSDPDAYDTVLDAGDDLLESRWVRARMRLYAELERLRGTGIDASGEVCDRDPLDTVRSVMARPPFDEVIVSTLPVGISRWLHLDLPNRLQRALPIPVSVVVASPISD